MSFLYTTNVQEPNTELNKCINEVPEDERDLLNFWANNANSDSESTDSEDNNQSDDVETLEDYALENLNYDPNFMQDDSLEGGFSMLEEGCIDTKTIFPFLPEDEVSAIKKCSDVALKNVLLLNRAKKIQLKTLNNKYHKLLLDCKNKITFETNRLYSVITQVYAKSCFKRFMYPYFRDKDDFLPPHNNDVIKKMENMEVNGSYLTKKIWNIWAQKRLKVIVGMQILKHMKADIENKIASLDTERDAEEISSLEDKEKRITESHDELEFPPLWDDSKLNWNQVSLAMYKDDKFALPCRAFWNLYLHPDIYKGPFTELENQKIVQLAKKNNYQNWEAILPELEHKRSGYLVCVQYFSKLEKPLMCNEPFSVQEDELLMQLIEITTIGNVIPWTNIQYHLHPRSKSQLYNRYKQLTEDFKIKKGAFSQNEDVLIQCLVKKYGNNFDKIAMEIPNRTKSQIIQRYNNYLSPTSSIELGNWTMEEDRCIMKHVKIHGAKNWRLLMKDMNRNVGHIRHRYKTIEKHMSKNPDVSLEDLPRRTWITPITKSKKEKSIQLAQAYIQKNTLPVLEAVKKEFSTTGRPVRTTVDEDLVDFFRTTAGVRKLPNLRAVFDHNITSCVNTINCFYKLLGFNLKVPTEAEISQYPLDTYDLEIIRYLRYQNSATYNLNNEEISVPSVNLTGIQADVPPNVNTIQALRCLILKYYSFAPKNKIKTDNFSPDVIMHLETFRERFNAIFRWPSLMSLVEPPTKLLEKAEAPKKVYAKKGRPSKDLSKVRKMNEARRRKVDHPGSQLVSKHNLQNGGKDKNLTKEFKHVVYDDGKVVIEIKTSTKEIDLPGPSIKKLKMQE